MTKIIAVLFFLISISKIVSGQNLEGRWNGTLSDFNVFNGERKILLDFYKISDTTFQVLNTFVSYYGYTSITLMNGFFYEKEKLHLEQIKIIKDYSGSDRQDCPMIFELNYVEKKGKITLDGKLIAKNGECSGGLIFLRKKS